MGNEEHVDGVVKLLGTRISLVVGKDRKSRVQCHMKMLEAQDCQRGSTMVKG